MAQGDQSVMVVGDLMLDVNLAVTERVNAENADVCWHGHKFQYFCGGAANVAHLVKEIGDCDVSVRGVLGDDWAGSILSDMLGEVCTGEFSNYTQTTDQAPTTVKFRAYNEGRIMARIDQEWVLLDRCPMVLTRTAPLMPEVLALVDYGKGVFSDIQMAEVRAIIDADRQTIVNPCPMNPCDWSGATVCIVNEEEHGSIGFTGALWTLITRGSQGGTLYHHETQAADFKVEAIEDAQLVGAGDSVTAMLASSLALGCAVPDAARRAIKYAGDYVQKPRPIVSFA